MTERGHFEAGNWIDDPMPEERKLEIFLNSCGFRGDLPTNATTTELIEEVGRRMIKAGNEGKVFTVSRYHETNDCRGERVFARMRFRIDLEGDYDRTRTF